MLKNVYTSLIFLLALSVMTAPSLRAEEESTLGLFGEEEAVLSTSRIPRPISRIAENVTVITAEEIALLNAHTLADVLNTVPGLQMQSPNRTPGSNSDLFVQGAEAGSGHVLVLIDGVQQNNYKQGWVFTAQIPVQQIERVEIVKGAASAAWGPALGGVVNVITKEPIAERPVGGTVSASIGERTTFDTRGELNGTIGNLGYYLSGGRLHSDGLRPNNAVSENNGYLKLTYDLPTEGRLTFGTSIWENADGDEGWFGSPGFSGSVHDDYKNYLGYSFLTLQQPLSERLSLELTGKGAYQETDTRQNDIIGGTISPYLFAFARESSWGGGAKLSWDGGDFGVVVGAEYDHANIYERTEINGVPDPFLLRRAMDRYGLYANGHLSFGRVTVLPGIRFDDTGFGSNYVSYNLGTTVRLTDRSVFRAYGARGYGLPSLYQGKDLQKVWTVQTGVESSDIPYLWLKGTLFYNRIYDGQWDANHAPDEKQTKQGFEIEARTTPWHGFYLSGGYTLNDSRDGAKVRHTMKPAHIAKLAVYGDQEDIGLKGVITGSYVWWNAPGYKLASYDTIIWDLHLTQKLPTGWGMAPELFFSARNLFNGAQYSESLYQNASRWVEGGVRFSF